MPAELPTALSNIMSLLLYYVQLENGNCALLEANDQIQAEYLATASANYAHTTVTMVAPAGDYEIAYVSQMGGFLPPSAEDKLNTILEELRKFTKGG